MSEKMNSRSGSPRRKKTFSVKALSSSLQKTSWRRYPFGGKTFPNLLRGHGLALQHLAPFEEERALLHHPTWHADAGVENRCIVLELHGRKLDNHVFHGVARVVRSMPDAAVIP